MSLPGPLPFPAHIPFVVELGCQLERFEDGEAELSLVLDPLVHTNSFGVAHGGVVMTLLDVAMAHAARSRHKDEPGCGPGIVTIEMKSSFMRPGLGRLRALGTVLHASAKMVFCEARVLNEAGELCAHATGTFKFLRALPVSGRATQPLAGPAPQDGGSD
jgi:uncharacterized protein (TIGR00369 family)